ncbi:DJ-1/PfpI family protein [Novosphingopyxis sp.]|uniref:DJ-1/PfpI family protein n=1 Tax=Novosphingopyxis sp. TaxID=2709690 RepID=UPI003B5AFAF6
MDHLTVAFVLFPNVTQLDLTGPVQVLSRLGNAKIELVAHSLEPVPTDAGFSIMPTTTFEECVSPDIVCVPGGEEADDAMEDKAILSWIRTANISADWTTSVCTGSLVLGAAGLLKGKRATCHWASLSFLEHFGAIPAQQRVVFDGRIVTGGGVTAGIDFALQLVAAIHGEDHAKLIQLSLEYDPAPPFQNGSPVTAEPSVLRAFHELTEVNQTRREKRVKAAAMMQTGRY